MGTFDRLKAALRREKRDIDEAVDEMTAHGNAVLDKKERELHATPSEKLAIEQDRAKDIDDEIEAIRRRLERGGDSGS